MLTVHHPTLYFDDGNVVLSALDAKGRRVYFRVHRSVLVRHSPILSDLFEIPPLRNEGPPHDVKEVYDDALHISMPDSAEDIESFLKVLYDPL